MSSTIYQQLQRQHYRITLDITAYSDFCPENIDWDKLFKLEGNEHCESYIENLSVPDTW